MPLESKPFDLTIDTGSKLILPELVVEPFIKEDKKRVEVQITFQSQTISYHAALIKNKNGLYTIYFSQPKQKKLGVFMNDYFTVQLFEEQTKYGVEMPEVLTVILQSDPEAKAAFEFLTSGRIRSLIYTIKRYKSERLKIEKALLILENIKKGRDTPKVWLKKA